MTSSPRIRLGTIICDDCHQRLPFEIPAPALYHHLRLQRPQTTAERLQALHDLRRHLQCVLARSMTWHVGCPARHASKSPTGYALIACSN